MQITVSQSVRHFHRVAVSAASLQGAMQARLSIDKRAHLAKLTVGLTYSDSSAILTL